MAQTNRQTKKQNYAPAQGGENAIIAYLRGILAGISGGAIAADPTGNMASNSGAFLPSSTLARTGSAGAAVSGVNRAAGNAYADASMKAGGALLAASVVPTVGLRNSVRGMAALAGREAAGAAAQVPRQSAARIAMQRVRGAEAIERQTGIPAAARPDNLLIPPAARPNPRVYSPTTRQPRPENARFDDPRGKTPVGVVREQLPKPQAATKSADSKPVEIDIPASLRGIDEASGKPKVRVSWDGVSQPNHQSFKKLDPGTGKYVKWDEGFKQARKRWKTRQTKLDTSNPNASADAFEGLTPRQMEQIQRMRQREAEGLVTQGDDPAVVKGSIEARRQEAAARSGNRSDSMRALMEQPPPGGNPRPAARLNNPGQGAERARGSRPVRKDGESAESFDARLAEWQQKRTVSNLSKTRKSLQAPKKKQGETPEAYRARVAEWRSNESSRMAQMVERERARVDAKLAESQPMAIRPDQLDRPTSPARVEDAYNPYAFLSRNLQPNRPAQRPAAQPAASAAAEGPKATPKPRTQKKTEQPKPEAVTETPATSAAVEGPKKPSSPRKPSAKKETKETKKPSAPSREVVDPRTTPTGPFSPNKLKPVPPKTGKYTPMSKRPEPVAPRGGFRVPPGGMGNPKAKLTKGQKIKKGAKTAAKAGALTTAAVYGVTTGMYEAGKKAEARKDQPRSEGGDKRGVDATSRPVLAAAKRTKEGLRDANGRMITREEFDARKAWREKNGLGRRPNEDRAAYKARIAKWKKENPKAWAKEEARRNNWRKSEGVKRFGRAATKATRGLKDKTTSFISVYDETARKNLR